MITENYSSLSNPSGPGATGKEITLEKERVGEDYKVDIQ